MPVFRRACKAARGHTEWAIVLLLPTGPILDVDESPVPEVVQMVNVPDDPHVAITSLHAGGAVQQGSVLVYQPTHSTAVWGAENTTALDAVKSVCGCNVFWQPHAAYQPKTALFPELTVSNAESLGKVVQSPHSEVAWLEPHRYCWVPAAVQVTSPDASPQESGATNVAVASHGSPTWTGAIRGTVLEAEIIRAAAYLQHSPPFGRTVHIVDASIVAVHLRRAHEALYRGIKAPISHLVNQHALNWIVEGLRRLPRRVGGLHHWLVRQSSHLAVVPLEEPDFAAAKAKAPPAHLLLPKEHAVLLVDSGHARQATVKCRRKRQEGDRVATGRRQGGDRKTTGKRQESDRKATGSNRQATGRQQESCDRRVTGGRQGGDRVATGRRQGSDKKQDIATG